MSESGEVIQLFGDRARGRRSAPPADGVSLPLRSADSAQSDSSGSRAGASGSRSIRDSAGATELQELLRATREARQAAIAQAQDSIAARVAGAPGTSDIDTQERPDARLIAQRALGRRALSEEEVRAKLVFADVDPDDINNEIARLLEQRIIDDDALAERLTEQLSERKKLGRSGIARALKERKIDPESIDRALDALPDDSEIDNAVELAERKSRSLQSLDFEVAQRRLWGHLQRKGFSSSVIKIAVQSALGDGRR